MNNEYREPEYHSNFLSILFSLLIGSLAGAVTMLLLAPQSGEDTRKQIQQKSIELRDRTTVMVGDAMTKVRADGRKLTIAGRQKANDLMHQGQTLVVDQLDHISEAAQAGKKTIQNS